MDDEVQPWEVLVYYHKPFHSLPIALFFYDHVYQYRSIVLYVSRTEHLDLHSLGHFSPHSNQHMGQNRPI